MKRLYLLLCLPMMALQCNKPDTPVTPDDPAPEAITLSVNPIEMKAEGGTAQLTITAPARPKLTGIPAWITVTDGTYKDYRIKLGINVKANENYDSRSADITVSSAGAPSLSLKVTQEGKEVIKDPELADNEAVRLSRTLGLGWNLGNHFDAYYNYPGAGDLYNFPSETVWGNKPATQETFSGAKKAGFKTVRIPVTWLNMIGEAPDYTIDKTWMDRVYEVVGFAHNSGLNVIINTHHDENHGDDHWLDIYNASLDNALNTAIKQKIAAVWTQIAERFADCGDWLIMEGFNELNDGGWGWSSAFQADPHKQCGILDQWNQTFVDAVRATGGNNATRWLGVPTYCANPAFDKYMTMPSDPAGKLMLSVHFYDPSDYTIGEKQYSDWGHTGAVGRKAAGSDEDHVKDVFNNLYTKYVAKNIPVYVGEFGCSIRAKSDTRAWAFFLYYMEYVAKAAKTFGMPCVLWDNGADGSGQERHGYLDHATGAYIGNSKDVIDVLVKAWTDSQGYTLQSVYDSAPVF